MQNEDFSLRLLQFFESFDGTTAYLVVGGVLLACGLGIPIPEDLTLIAAGILAALGKISLIGALLVGYFGVLVGDAILFFAGRKYGKNAFKVWPLSRFMTPERVTAAEDRIQNNAKFVCFIARFLPGLRAPIYLTAGVLRVKPSTFLFQDGLAALLSVPIWVVGAYHLGRNLDAIMEFKKTAGTWLLIGVAIAMICWWFYKRLNKKNHSPQI